MINCFFKVKYRILLPVVLLFMLNSGRVISNNPVNNELSHYEDSLNHYFSLILAEQDDLKKEEINNRILYFFREALNKENSFTYSFEKLKNIGVIYSPDNQLRIINWNLPYSDRTHKYFGFIQYYKSKRKVLTYELNDKSDEINTPEFAILDHNNWYGALYYKIVVNKYKGNVYYTLLGADLNDLLTKKKIVEVLYFNKSDIPVFGKQVFKNRKLPVSRVIFEFNAQSNMVLTYDEEKLMIIYDHLSPSRPSLKGQYEFYGPDFSYDGLKFERGIWNTYPDIDVRNYNID